MKKFIKDIFNKGNFKDYFKRNKIFLIVSLIVLVLSIYSGFTDSQSYIAFSNHSFGQSFISNNSIDTLSNILTSFAMMLYNNLYIIVMGLSFSVLAMLSFVANTVSIGYLLNQLNTSLSVPSVIFMLIASVFAMCGAFLVTKMEVRFIGYLINSKKNSLTKLKVPLKDLILSMVIMIICILIASILNAVLL